MLSMLIEIFALYHILNVKVSSSLKEVTLTGAKIQKQTDNITIYNASDTFTLAITRFKAIRIFAVVLSA